MDEAFACEAGRLGSILSWATRKTSKFVSAASLALGSTLKSCAKDEEISRWINATVKINQLSHTLVLVVI